MCFNGLNWQKFCYNNVNPEWCDDCIKVVQQYILWDM